MGNTELKEQEKPELSRGVASSKLPEGGMITGHVGEDDVLIVRQNGKLYAIGATCSHYGAPLAEGLLVDDTVRCPWHHACFELNTGVASRAPALSDLVCWTVTESAGTIKVGEKLPKSAPAKLAQTGLPESIVIIGGGAAGNMAAETLRREGYDGPVTIISADDSAPYDRPTLSKDFLAGKAQDDWVPLHGPDFYAEKNIDLMLGTYVQGIDPIERKLQLSDGKIVSYGALLLATGATPSPLDIPGANLPHVHLLRSLADSKMIIERAAEAKSCVVIGASFIGLEAAASLRQRDKSVHVVAPDKIPMARIMGERIGEMVMSIHKGHGVNFHLETKPVAIEPEAVVLENGERIAADLVIVGIGVKPNLALAESAGLDIDRGLLVDEFLETSIKGIYAAGDIARWPDPNSGERIRVEHWVVAERQGQVAARNMLGRRERFDAVPFFWSQHYDTSIRYVGHAEKWDDIRIDGDVDAKDFSAMFVKAGRKLAVVTVGRDLEALKVEVDFENEAAVASSTRKAS
ncbi:MAG: FAD-dependent oxidoreductase [Methylovirgula sp.]